MTSIIEELENSEHDLYSILELQKTATLQEIKKAYRKKALKCHPDKLGKNDSEEKIEEAKLLWQKISIAYDILSQEKSRKKYDKTGSIKDAKDYEFNEDFSWEQYFENIYGGLIDEEKITNFEKTYKYSEEEKTDVINAYNEGKGDLEYVLDNVPLCTSEDYPRFVEIINQAITEKKIKKYRRYNKNYKTAMEKRRKEEEKEKKAFEKQQQKKKKEKAKEGKDNGDDDEECIKKLSLTITENRKRRLNETIDHLLEKYENENIEKNANRKKPKNGNGKTSKKRKTTKNVYEEPSEEEFLKLQEKLFGKKKNN